MTKIIGELHNHKSLVQETRLLTIFLLGFSSGLPFLLILSTLNVWLVESGISKTQIGVLAWVTIPYALKFCWAPCLDYLKVPFLCRWLGQRRGWILAAQIALMGALIGLGFTEPASHIRLTAVWALLVGFFSATQDIAVEAYRVEVLPREQVGYGASASVLGYRFGMLIAGAGAMYLAAYFPWSAVYSLMAACVFIGVLATLCSQEPPTIERASVPPKLSSMSHGSWFVQLAIWYQQLVKQPLKSLFKASDWYIVLPFIFTYKAGDTIINAMSMPFLMEMGFTKVEIAHVAKTFGITAMIVGGLLGGLLLSRWNLRRCLFICSTLQILASTLFIVQASVGYQFGFLFLTMGIENLVCGMTQVALIAYLSRLCHQPYTASHYALLSSFASLVRVALTTGAGWLADHLLWSEFYLVVALGCIPSLIFIYYCSKHFLRISLPLPEVA